MSDILSQELLSAINSNQKYASALTLPAVAIQMAEGTRQFRINQAVSTLMQEAAKAPENAGFLGKYGGIDHAIGSVIDRVVREALDALVFKYRQYHENKERDCLLDDASGDMEVLHEYHDFDQIDLLNQAFDIVAEQHAADKAVALQEILFPELMAFVLRIIKTYTPELLPTDPRQRGLFDAEGKGK